MLPEQLKAARALLNWSLERLARESGIHRNTISNFETRKFGGEPDTLATIKHTLENTGVIFPEENAQDAGISFRRFQLGDHVRLRPQSNIYSRYNVAEGEIGEVVWVEPHPPATGPTYRIHVKFEHAIVRGDFKFEYELVQAVSATALEQTTAPTLPRDPASILEDFCDICTEARSDYGLYKSLFESDPRNVKLFTSIAPLCFWELRRILAQNVLLQICKITDPAGTGKKTNLTTNFVLEKISWPAPVADKLRHFNDRLLKFRTHIEPARSRRIAHTDLTAQIERLENLGTFPAGADVQFFLDLQTFIDIAYGHFHNGGCRPIALPMSTDADKMVRALEKSVVFDLCTNCSEGSRSMALLDHLDQCTADADAVETYVPFDPLVPNATTIAAMQEARAGNLPRVNSIEELKTALRTED